MTDRVHSLTVVLTVDIRVDDVEPLINAIQMLRGVLRVDPHVADLEAHMAEQRAKRDLRDRLWEILK